jgi:serine/threonine protein kinase
MSLAPGTRLGPYEVSTLLGAGGMGEVYRARDTKLHRDVAPKVLPASLAADVDRLARLRREAQLLAALNHPHIAQIYGFEDSGATHALVMELVEGETLAERLSAVASGFSRTDAPRAKGSDLRASGASAGHAGLSRDEAVASARQIVDALEAAHEQGIVHRDLKPANIKVRADGEVKVLDFGLAKFGAGWTGGAGSVDGNVAQGFSPANMSQSPTIMPPAQTMGGVILGTAAYMSPEQARGKAVDKRTDIWAFGCVLFEMLAGAQAFGGETVSDSIANVLGKDPDWNALPASTPASVRRLMTRCLERDPKRRLHDIADARLDLEEAIGQKTTEPPRSNLSSPSRMTPAVVGLVAGVALLVGAAGASVALRNRGAVSAPASEVVRFTVSLPPGVALEPSAPAAVISPDGRHLVIVGRDNPSDQQSDALFLRSAGDVIVKKIKGTEHAFRPFFSPDGRWIGFFRYVGGALMKIPVDGGVPIAIAPVNSSSPQVLVGADWGSDGTIVFAQRGPTSDPIGLWRVSALGGSPTELLLPDATRGELQYRWPQFVDAEHVMFDIRRQNGSDAVAIVSMKTGQKHVVVENATYGRVTPSGHFLFMRGGNLLAATLTQGGEINGEPLPAQQGIGYDPGTRGVDFTLATASGAAAMVVRSPAGYTGSSTMVWVDRKGQATGTAAPDRGFRQPQLSPDGQRVLVGVDGATRDVWLFDFRRDLLSRLTTDSSSSDETPLWSPDGLSVAWTGNRDGRPSVLMRRVDGSNAERRVWSADEHLHLNAWAPDGRLLIEATRGPQRVLLELTVEPEIRARPFLESKFSQYGAAVSPDGRRVAFVAEQGGEAQVFLTTRSGTGRVQVSSGGGNEPVWSRDGREPFFRSGPRLMSAAVTTGAALEVGHARALFEGTYRAGGREPSYAVSPDGQRFLMLRPVAPSPSSSEVVVTLNWLEELKRLAPITKH